MSMLAVTCKDIVENIVYITVSSHKNRAEFFLITIKEIAVFLLNINWF